MTRLLSQPVPSSDHLSGTSSNHSVEDDLTPEQPPINRVIQRGSSGQCRERGPQNQQP